jgi:hypothetical protein
VVSVPGLRAGDQPKGLEPWPGMGRFSPQAPSLSRR